MGPVDSSRTLQKPARAAHTICVGYFWTDVYNLIYWSLRIMKIEKCSVSNMKNTKIWKENHVSPLCPSGLHLPPLSCLCPPSWKRRGQRSGPLHAVHLATPGDSSMPGFTQGSFCGRGHPQCQLQAGSLPVAARPLDTHPVQRPQGPVCGACIGHWDEYPVCVSSRRGTSTTTLPARYASGVARCLRKARRCTCKVKCP